MKRELPKVLKKLEKESKDKNVSLPKKYQKLADSKNCKGDFEEVTSAESKQLVKFAEDEGKTLHFACSRTKDIGGSGGVKRFILIYSESGKFEAIELKPLTTPAPLYGRRINNEDRQHQFRDAVRTFLGPEHNLIYFSVLLDDKLYQRRPLWGGNVGVERKDLGSKKLSQLFLFEAHTLGSLHRLSNSTGHFNYSAKAWEKMAQEIETKWKAEIEVSKK